MGVHFFGKHVTITDLNIVTPVTANKMDVQMIRTIIQMFDFFCAESTSHLINLCLLHI